MRETILEYSTQIESLLVELGATGRGMHEKLTSVESIIATPTLKKIRWIATIRNKAVHEANFSTDLNDFVENAKNSIDYLQNLLAERKKQQTNNMKDESKKKTNDGESSFNWELETVVKVALGIGTAIATIFFSQR